VSQGGVTPKGFDLAVQIFFCNWLAGFTA